MRTAGLMLCLALIVAACGDDTASPLPDAADTSSTTAAADTTSSTEAGTTSSTEAAATTTAASPVATAQLCVIGRAPGQFADIRMGPDAGSALVSQLAADTFGVQATGNTAVDGGGTSWTEIIWEGAAAWVQSFYLTPGNCDPGGGPTTYAVNDIVCGSFVNVRDGVSGDHGILGTLEPEDFNIPGTGVTALDDEGRTWVQIQFEGRNAWVAGWFMTTDPGPTIDCSLALPWSLTANALGPIQLGTQASTLQSVTGWTWTLQDSNNNCTWYVSNDVGVQAQSGVIVEIWAMSAAVAVTPEGFRVGQTKAQAAAAFGGRAVTVPGPYVGEVIIIDAANWQQNFTYLLIEDPFDTNVIGTIRINDDGGYIEGGCS
jgi:uncharacterized protein YgiM (DUF1202 family)